MLRKLQHAAARLRRSIAQRGVRHALWNVGRRILQRDLSTHQPAREYPTDPHPFDTAAGVDTSGMIHGSALATGHAHDVYNVAYYGTSPSLFRAAFARWLATPGVLSAQDYTFIDFGSGKGRVVMLAAEQPFRSCIGVELNPELNAIAERNMVSWADAGHSRSPMQALSGEATAFDFPATPCLVYLFNPFTGKVLARLLENIAVAFADRPGTLDILYVNAEFRDVLLAHPGFTLLWEQPLAMSAEDAAIDIHFTGDGTGRKLYGEIGQEICSAWRFTGRPSA